MVYILIYLENAYDTTGKHGILLELYVRGMSVVVYQCISANLYVPVGNIYSDPHLQEAGVPQGSILSVKLFSLKINSIVFVYCFYVDELAIYYISSHMPSIEIKLQQSLNRLGR